MQFLFPSEVEVKDPCRARVGRVNNASSPAPILHSSMYKECLSKYLVDLENITFS